MRKSIEKRHNFWRWLPWWRPLGYDTVTAMVESMSEDVFEPLFWARVKYLDAECEVKTLLRAATLSERPVMQVSANSVIFSAEWS